MKQCISANYALLIYKVCQIYAARVSENFTSYERQTSSLSHTPLASHLTFLTETLRMLLFLNSSSTPWIKEYSTHAILFGDVSAFSDFIANF